eukprot:jgi/Tetstr1/448107/TSEL_035405.t1
MTGVASSSARCPDKKRGCGGIHLQPKRKRRGANISPRPQLLASLREVGLMALEQGGGFWLSVGADAALLLDQAGFGAVDGGRQTAEEVAAILGRPQGDGADAGPRSVAPSSAGGAPEAGPHPVSVRLSMEEALYMLWVDGILRVFQRAEGGGVEERSAAQLWGLAVSRHASFPARYVAYHHFRAKGFLPRSGLQYGADLVVYPRHPTECHSDACVRIIPSSGEQPAAMPGWHDLAATSRLCNAVSKGLMLLFVHRRPGADPATLSCLSYFEVREVMFRRWQASEQT